MNALATYFTTQLPAMLQFTERLVNQDSPATEPANIQQAVALVQAKMEALHMTVHQLNANHPGTILIGELPGTLPGRPVILSGHLDTVFPTGTAAQRPFTTTQSLMSGPGIFDMKPGLTMGLFAIQALQALQLPHRAIRMLVITDEEKIHRDSTADQALAQAAQGADFALNLEGSAALNQVTTTTRGGMIVEVAVQGQAAHSGAAPEAGRSAILELAHQIIQLEALSDLTAGLHVNCGTITGGSSENIIPDFAKTQLGVRFKTNAQREHLLAQIQAIAATPTVAGTQTTVTVKTKIDSLEPTTDSQTLLQIADQHAQTIGIGPLAAIASGGASDAGIIAAQGIPTLDGLGIVGGKAHTKDEFAVVESLLPRTQLIAALLQTTHQFN